jgi:hypothetical protein
MALYLLVLRSRVYKWSINPFTNPNHVYSHIYVTIFRYLFYTSKKTLLLEGLRKATKPSVKTAGVPA